jgi:DNA-binding transcriptional LysR family regulator
LRVEIDLSSHMVNLIEEGFDVALRAAVRIDDGSLVARRLMSTDLHLFASPAYLARRGTPVSPEELAEHDCVLFRPVNGQSDWTYAGPDGKERQISVTGRVAGNDFAFLRSVLRMGAGIGLLPSFLGARDVAEGRLLRVLPSVAQPAATLFIVYPSARHVPLKVTAFRDFMLESFRKQGAPPARAPRA